MTIYKFTGYDESIQNLNQGLYNEHDLPSTSEFQHYDGTPVAIINEAHTMHLCMHDNHKIDNASVTLCIGDAKITLRLTELLKALAISSGRRAVSGEQMFAILGFSSPSSLQEAALLEKEALDGFEKTRQAEKEAFERTQIFFENNLDENQQDGST